MMEWLNVMVLAGLVVVILCVAWNVIKSWRDDWELPDPDDDL